LREEVAAGRKKNPLALVAPGPLPYKTRIIFIATKGEKKMKLFARG
jgi:hypothetical protein